MRVGSLEAGAAKPMTIAPKASSPEALARMKRQQPHGTKPELRLRSDLHRRGLRFRVQQRVLPGVRRTVDIVFPAARVAVEVRGCYWHACEEHGTRPRANAEWWEEKLRRNVERDRETERMLGEAGWHVIVVWEHEVAADAADAIEKVVRARRDARRVK